MAGQIVSVRQELRWLVDHLPDAEAPVAKRFLEYLAERGSDPVLRALVAAPADDEPVTPEEEKAVLLKTQDVAEILNVSEARVYQLVRENMLPAVRLGRQVRFNPEAIEEFIKAGGQGLPGGWRKDATGRH